MNVAVVGSRSFKNYTYLCNVLDALRRKRGEFTLVSGGARGADSLAERYAEANHIKKVIIVPAWDDLSQPDAVVKHRFDGTPYDALAGFRRNQQIVDAADLVIAFMDERKPSNGTSDTIRRAREKKLPVYIFWKD